MTRKLLYFQREDSSSLGNKLNRKPLRQFLEVLEGKCTLPSALLYWSEEKWTQVRKDKSGSCQVLLSLGQTRLK